MDILNFAKDILRLEASELERHANSLDSRFCKALELIKNAKGKLIVTGVGKSGHIGAKIAATAASTGTPAFFLHPTEAMHGDLGMIADGDIILAISYSGESGELLAILPHIKARGVKVIAMSKENSSLARLSDVNLSLDIEREACPFNAAPSVSTTLTLALGDALALSLMKLKNFAITDFAAFHPGGALGKRLFLKVYDVMRKENLPTINENASLKEAISAMSTGKLGSAIILNASKELAGIISDGDLRRALENPSFDLSAKALNFATKSPKTLSDENTLAYDALKILQENKIQILIITKENKPIGVLHIHDLTALGL